MKQLIEHLPEDHPYRRFSNFSRVVWKHLQLPQPTDIQREFCDYLQFGPDQSQIQAFRGAGKTYITAAYVCWRLYLNPEEIVLIISAAKETADQICRFIRRLISEIPELQHLEPDVSRGDQDSSVSFQVGCASVKKSPTVTSKGITSQLTGSRSSLIILDDCEVPNNSASPAMRENLVERLEEMSAILLPPSDELKIYPQIKVLGTPQSTHTIYQILEQRGFETRIWPIMRPTEEMEERYGTNTSGEHRLAESVRKAETKPGTPMEPTRFTAENIAERQLKYSKASFDRQFMLSTDLSDDARFPLKLRDAMFTEFPKHKAREIYVHGNRNEHRIHRDHPGLPGDGFFRPAMEDGLLVPFDTTILAVDPSGRGKDETGICVASTLSGYIFIHSVRGLQGGYSEPALLSIAREAAEYSVDTVLVESNFGDGAVTELLKPILRRNHGCSLEEVRNSTMKEARMLEALSPPNENHKLVFHTRIIDQDHQTSDADAAEKKRFRQLFWQFTHLEHLKGCLVHDDRIDALSMAVEYLTESLNRDAHHAKKQREDEELDMFLREWDDKASKGEDSVYWDTAIGSKSGLMG